jgi:hypothetical protein
MENGVQGRNAKKGELHKRTSEPRMLTQRLLLSQSLSQTAARGFAERGYYLNPDCRTRRAKGHRAGPDHDLKQWPERSEGGSNSFAKTRQQGSIDSNSFPHPSF